MTLWHLNFPLARHRHLDPAFREYATPEAAERQAVSASTDLAVLALFDADPDRGFTDRAMDGWCPGDRALDTLRAQLGQWAKGAAGEVA